MYSSNQIGKNMKTIIVAISIILLSVSAFGEIFKWVDENGVVNYSNKNQNKAETEITPEIKFDPEKAKYYEKLNEEESKQNLLWLQKENEENEKREISEKKAKKELEEKNKIANLEKLLIESNSKLEKMQREIQAIKRNNRRYYRFWRKPDRPHRKPTKKLELEMNLTKKEIQKLKIELNSSKQKKGL
jgi:beta-xylosidase